MDEKFEFENLPAQHTAQVRVRTPVERLPELIGRSYGQILALIQEQGVEIAGHPYTAYFNLDMNDLDVEIGFPVSDAITAQGEIRSGEIPAGKYATCMYMGPYSEMEPTYNKLTDWIAAQGAIPVGIAYEQYLNGPDEVTEDELLTKILLPVTDA